jgi:D-alanine-D-alanine ligase
VERFVPGAEVAVCVRGADLAPLPAVEIRTRSGAFDFETRVSPGAFEFVCPTGAADARALGLAVNAATTLGVRDFARVDLRVGPDGPTVLDVKTCPGLTESSIVPLAVQNAGMRFEEFVADVVDAALARSPGARA